MGSFTLAVESTARDVNALLTLHRVHPQVRSDVQRLLQHLVKKSYEHMKSLQPGFEESAEQVCRAIATDIVKHAVTIAIPVSQLSGEERQSAQYYQALQESKQEQERLRQQQKEAQTALTDLKQAHDYMLHSYFHEVLILRQRIDDLQLQQKKGVSAGLSGLGAASASTMASGVHRVSYGSLHSAGSRLSTSAMVDMSHATRADQRPDSSSSLPAAASPGEPYRLGDALRGVLPPPPPHPTSRSTSPFPPAQRATSARGHSGVPPLSLDASDGARPRTSISDLASPPNFLQTARFGTSAAVTPSSTNHASQPPSYPPQHTASVATLAPAKEQTMMLYALSHPAESVDAVFDYERYVSLLNGSTGAWDERYVELLVAKEEAEELVTKERSKRRVGFQFAKAERRDRFERMEHEVQLEQARNNKWWWAQKLALEEVRRDYATRIAAIREEMDTLRSTMMHDYIFNLQQAMNLLQSRIDVLLNFFLVYIKATDETVRTIQRDARARSRADLLVTDHHSLHSSEAIKTFFENPENERERPNVAAELMRLQGEFWRAEAKQAKNTESKEVHPLYLLNDPAQDTSSSTAGNAHTRPAGTSAKEATATFRAKAQHDEANPPSREPGTSPAGGGGPSHDALGERVRQSVSKPSPPPPPGLDNSGGELDGRVSPPPSTYRTDGLPYWEAHPLTEGAQQVFDHLQGLARKLRLRKAVQLENEIRITSSREQKVQPAWRERLHDSRGRGGDTRGSLAGSGTRRKKSSRATAVAHSHTDDDDSEVTETLTESTAWAMVDGWEDAQITGDAHHRTAREVVRELVRLRLHRVVATVRRRTTLLKLQGLLDVVEDGDGGSGSIRARVVSATSGTDSSVFSGDPLSGSARARRRRRGRPRSAANLLSIDHLRDDGTTSQDVDSDEELDIRIAMLTKVCQVAEDRIHDDTLRINELLRLLRNHKLLMRDWEKERQETDEERAARLAREKAEREAHLARLLASPYWKAPPQRFYGQRTDAISFLPAGLLQAYQRPMASHITFQGEQIPINAFLQQPPPSPRQSSHGTKQSERAGGTPSLSSRVVTRGQRRTPYAAVMDYCQGVQMGLPMSDRRGPVYLQYDATTDAYFVADDEGTDLVAEGERRLTQLMNSAQGGGDESANNIFNSVGTDSGDRTGPSLSRGRTLNRWTVPMTQVLFPAPSPVAVARERYGDNDGTAAECVDVPGTRHEGAFVYITDPDATDPTSTHAATQIVDSAQTSLAPMYLVPVTLPGHAYDSDGHTVAALGAALNNPTSAYPGTPMQWWAAVPASQLQSIWRTQRGPDVQLSGTTTGLSARAANMYYHDPPTVFRPPTEEQGMLAIAGYQLPVPAPVLVPTSSTTVPPPSTEDGTSIRYNGQEQNYTTLFPVGSTFYSAASHTRGDAVPLPMDTSAEAPSRAPPTSFIQDPLGAAATSIAKARQLQEARRAQSQQAVESAQRERQQEWHDRLTTREPTEKEKFLRLRLPHLAPLPPTAPAAAESPAPSLPPPAPSLASAPLTTAAPRPLDAVRLQQQLRASRGKVTPADGRGSRAPAPAAGDVVDRRALPATATGGTGTRGAVESRQTTGHDEALAGGGGTSTTAPLRLPAEFVQITQPRTTTTTDTTSRGANHLAAGSGRRSHRPPHSYHG